MAEKTKKQLLHKEENKMEEITGTGILLILTIFWAAWAPSDQNIANKNKQEVQFASMAGW